MQNEATALNACILNDDAQKTVSAVKTAVIGAGGLGGFVAQGLVRLGAQNITVIDGDVFTPSNLNRQFFCDRNTLDKAKAEVCVGGMLRVFPEGNYKAVCNYINENNAETVLDGSEIVFDCADNIKTKLLLEKVCIKKNVPLIHAGISGNYGQTAIIYGKPLLESLFRRESQSRNAVILPQITAGYQLNLFAQYLNKTYIKNKLYLIDLDAMQISDINY